MPTYVYECSSCSSTFEVEQRITEDPLKTCRCGSTGTVKRVIQPIAVMFKGSGFHINDYSGTKSESKPTSEQPKAAAEPASNSNGELAPAPTPTESSTQTG